jgi:putative transposase
LGTPPFSKWLKEFKVPQSLSSIVIHLVFSTKNREAWLRNGIKAEMHAYLGGVLRELNCPSIIVGGTADHVHLLFRLARTASMAEVVEEVKKRSSKWLKTKGPQFQDFHWQTGYGAFSVGQDRQSIERVRLYIERQEEHHRVRSFQEEYRLMLNKYGIAFDEKYVWD